MTQELKYGFVGTGGIARGARFRINTPVDSADPAGGKIPMESWPFRHMGMESMSVLACAMNECLLQSHDGVIRVAPAVTEKQNARFTLHAAGGFVVSAEILDGKSRWIGIRSLRGGPCKVNVPWTNGHLLCDTQSAGSIAGGVRTVPTVAGDWLLLTPSLLTSQEWRCVSETVESNAKPKTDRQGRATLGLPRMF